MSEQHEDDKILHQDEVEEVIEAEIAEAAETVTYTIGESDEVTYDIEIGANINTVPDTSTLRARVGSDFVTIFGKVTFDGSSNTMFAYLSEEFRPAQSKPDDEIWSGWDIIVPAGMIWDASANIYKPAIVTFSWDGEDPRTEMTVRFIGADTFAAGDRVEMCATYPKV